MNRRIRGSLINAERQELDPSLTEVLGLSEAQVSEIEASSEAFWEFKVRHTSEFIAFMRDYDEALDSHPDRESFLTDDSDESHQAFSDFNKDFLDKELENPDSFYTGLCLSEERGLLRMRTEAALFWGNSDEYEERADLEGFLYTLQDNLAGYWSKVNKPGYDHEESLCDLSVTAPALIFTKFDAESVPLFLKADLDTQFKITDTILGKIDSGDYTAISQMGWLVLIYYLSGDSSYHPEFSSRIKAGEFDDFVIEGASLLIGSDSSSSKVIAQSWFAPFLQKWFDRFRETEKLADLDSPIWTQLIDIFDGKTRLPAKIKTYRGRLVAAKAKGARKVKGRSKVTSAKARSASTPTEDPTPKKEGPGVPTEPEKPEVIIEPVFMAPPNTNFSLSDDLSSLSISCDSIEGDLSLSIYMADVSAGGKSSNATRLQSVESGPLDLSSIRSDRGDRLEFIVVATNQNLIRSRDVLNLNPHQATRYRVNFLDLEAQKKAEEEALARAAEEAEREKWELIEAGVVSFEGHRKIEAVGDDGLMKLQFDESLAADIGVEPGVLPFEITFARNQDGAIEIKSFFGVKNYGPQYPEAICDFLDAEAQAFESFQAMDMLGGLHSENEEMSTTLDMILSSPELRPKMALYWQEAFGNEAAEGLLERIRLHLSPAYEFSFTGDEEEIETIRISHESGQFLEVYCGKSLDRLFKIIDQRFDDHRLRVVLAELAKMILSSLAHQALSVDEKEEAEANNENLRGKKEDAIKRLNLRSGRGFRGRYGKPEKNIRWAEALQNEEKIVLLRSRLSISRVDSTASISYSEDQYLRLEEALEVPNFRQYLWRRIIDTYANGVAELPPTYKASGATIIERPELKKGIMIGARRVFSPDELGKILAGDIRTRDLVEKQYQNQNALDLFVSFMEECKVGITVSEDVTLDAQDLFTFAKREGLEVVF